jgi:hypothetical protein
MYTYHPKNTGVPADLVTESFIAGFTELYAVAKLNPNLRQVPIQHVEAVRTGLKQLGYRTRIRYRGPHSQQRDTLRRDARAFTVYFQE